MAKDETQRLKPDLIDKDRDAYDALVSIKSYKPANKGAALPLLAKLLSDRDKKRAEETALEAALKAARDDANAAEWAFHNAMITAKDQVRAQFGRDSNELQALGLKKESERKAPRRKPKASE